jgi:hypothetical protein
VSTCRSVSGYDIYRRDPGFGSFSRLNQSPVPDTAFIDRALQPGEYHYYIDAIITGCNYITSSDTVTVDVITSIEDRDHGLITLYPNPAGDVLKITCDKAINGIEVSGMLGNVVSSLVGAGSDMVVLDISDLLPGVYIARILTVDGIRCERFIVAR